MKKILSVVVLLVISVATYAQKDVTKFLGIPVDGYKTEMIQELKAKGFTVHPLDNNVLQGEFNGHDVNVYIVTNNNRVYRIMLADKNTTTETDVKIRYNRLCEQFISNSNYVALEDQTIPKDEKISYEMLVNKKRYVAAFYQSPDTVILTKDLKYLISQKYTQDELANPTEEIQSEIQSMSVQYLFERLEKKTVWFTISEIGGEYCIIMYYDNKYNEANGEDL